MIPAAVALPGAIEHYRSEHRSKSAPVDPELDICHRRYLVDRQRWEDNILEGVEQTRKYWRFLDGQREQ